MRTMTAFNRTLLSAVLMTSTALALSGCKLRFAQPQEAAAPQPVQNKIGLKAAVRETSDPLKPYEVDITVSAKKYNGLVLVKATEQIPIDQKVSMKGLQVISQTPGKSDTTYAQLSKITDAEFQYADKNVNPHDVFWYAVIRPDSTGETGVIEEQGQLPQPSRVQIPASKGTPTVILAASVENSGTGLKPYVVKLSVSAPMSSDTDLKLVRANDSSDFVAGNYTVLAQINSSPFVFNDNVLYPTDSAVYGVINSNSAHQYVIPSPASITLPSLNNSFAELQLTQVQELGQLPKAKLTFNSVFGKTVLKKMINGLEVDSIELSQGQTEYLDEDLAFDKNFSYQLSQFDYYNNPSGISSSLAVKYDWPLIDFNTEFAAAVNPRAALHQYQIRLDDLSTVKRILQVQISGDGTNFTTAQTWTDETSTRNYTIDFSAPTVRYARIVQLDRNNNPLKTSSIYTLTVPQDLEFSGTTTLTQNHSGIGRFKLNSGATLIYGVLPTSISADHLIGDNASIRAFAIGSRAALNTDGRNAGDLTLSFKTAEGTITFDSRGEAGGNGSPGSTGSKGTTGTTGSAGTNSQWTCHGNGLFLPANIGDVTTHGTNGGPGGPGGVGGAGGPGLPGKTGGASGKITIHVSANITGFNPTYLTTAAAAGVGGAGGTGGDGGNPGPGGLGGMLGWTRGEAQSMCPSVGDYMNIHDPSWYSGSLPHPASSYDFPFCYSPNIMGGAPIQCPYGETKRRSSGANGAAGAKGADGVAGPAGIAGQVAQSCRRYPGESIQTCN